MQPRLRLTGMGSKRAWLLVRASFGGRACRPRQAGGAWSGLTPTPSARGTTAYAQGIATAGNAPSRALAMALAWGWRRWQPQSARPQWSQQRLGPGRSRGRRLGLVALARQRLMALWRFGETGGVPDGAVLQAAGRRSPRDGRAARRRWRGQLERRPGARCGPILSRGCPPWRSPGAISACRRRGSGARGRHGEKGVGGRDASRSRAPRAQVAAAKSARLAREKDRIRSGRRYNGLDKNRHIEGLLLVRE